MTADRLTAITVGVLFILATALPIVSVPIFGPLLTGPDYLANVAANAGIYTFAVALIVAMAGAVVAIAVAFYPVLKRTGRALAIGYVAARTIEGTLALVATAVWLGLLQWGRAFVLAGMPAESHFQSIGDLMFYAADTTFTLGTEIVFGVSAVILGYLLIRSRIVPLWLSGWGLIGGALLFVSGALNLNGISVPVWEAILTLPIAIQEMVLALWLIVRGFSAPAGAAVPSGD
jgi:hypothetical protein